MELTREELLLAARRAENYPPGYGYRFSCSKTLDERETYIDRLLCGEADPTLACPAVAVALSRAIPSAREVFAAYADLCITWRTYANYPYDYPTALNFRPLVVASELRRIAASFPEEEGVTCA